MKLLEKVYFELKRHELVANECQFSTDWMNMSKRYYSYVKFSGNEPNMEALSRLLANIKKRHDVCKDSRYGELREHAVRLKPLLEMVWSEFNERALERQVVGTVTERRRNTSFTPFPSEKKAA